MEVCFEVYFYVFFLRRIAMDSVSVNINIATFCPSGIDVEQVTIVVNFDLPVDQTGLADCETYLHRIGRTGNLVDGRRSSAVLRQIVEHFGRCRRCDRGLSVLCV